MDEWIPTPEFEESIRHSFGIPEMRSTFVDHLYTELMDRAGRKSRNPFFLVRRRPAWTIAFVILLLMIVATLWVGPQRVYGAVLHILGYIPGVGIIDQSHPIRMLANPVSLTREGITISINQAVLTFNETRLDYGVSGVPLSAYPRNEAVTGCIEREYLRLPDGSRVDIGLTIPAHVNDATFVLPCIFNTLPGTVPTDWELPLHFIPAPPDLTILPLIEVTSQKTPTSTPSEVSTEIPVKPQLGTPMTTPTAMSEGSLVSISVDKIIETKDGYILFGSVRPHLPEENWLQITGAATIRDADGKKVNYSIPDDVQPLDNGGFSQGGFDWVMQIKGMGVEFPLTIGYPGVILNAIDRRASANISVDVGLHPQPEQVWNVDREVELAGYPVRLVFVSALEDGYSFHIDPGRLSAVSVEIEGHPAIGGGGGGTWGGEFNTSLVYDELPKGVLKIRFSNPIIASPTTTWQVDWQPEQLREFTPLNDLNRPCFDANTYSTIKNLPEGLDGNAVFTQLNPEIQIVLAALDGSQKYVVATSKSRAALSQDGLRLAYSSDNGIIIQDLRVNDSITIPNIFGRDLHWSADGKRLAYVNSADLFGIFVIEVDGTNQKRLTNLGYESIAGWSPDGATLYYAIPGSTNAGFLLRSADVSTGMTQDVFVLEKSSRKAPLPALSPDGKQIAYRASDNSSLYIKNMNGYTARLVLEDPGLAVNGIVWEKEGHLLGVSLITDENKEGEMILMAPDSCETYRLPGLSGELDGISIP